MQHSKSKQLSKAELLIKIDDLYVQTSDNIKNKIKEYVTESICYDSNTVWFLGELIPDIVKEHMSYRRVLEEYNLLLEYATYKTINGKEVK